MGWVQSLATHLPTLETVRFGSHRFYSNLESEPPQVWIIERTLHGFEVRSEAQGNGRVDEGYIFAKEIDPWQPAT